jgi:hypothetical protein
LRYLSLGLLSTPQPEAVTEVMAKHQAESGTAPRTPVCAAGDHAVNFCQCRSCELPHAPCNQRVTRSKSASRYGACAASAKKGRPTACSQGSSPVKGIHGDLPTLYLGGQHSQGRLPVITASRECFD